MQAEILAVVNSVDDNKERLLELLSKLVAFPTPAPPGRNSDAAQAFVSQFLNQNGFTVDQWDLYPHDSIVVGTKQSAASSKYQSLILNGHMDVAAIQTDEKWHSNPFELVLRDGLAIGRGVADMKGALAAMLMAIQLLNEAQVALPGMLKLESVIGEESGEAGTWDAIKRGHKADFAIVGDISDFHIQGQGGVITGWITIKSDQTFHDATRRQMMNAGGHLRGASAIEKMMKVIAGLNELERDWAINKSYPGVAPGSDTINPAVIEGGRNAAFIADECRLWVTVHFYPNEDYQEVIKEVENHINRVAKADLWLKDHMPIYKWGGKSMVEDRGEIFPALDLAADSKPVALLKAAHYQVTADQAIVDVSPSVTDGGWFGHAKIPAAIYGPGTIDEAHSVDEAIQVDELVKYTKVLIQFMYEWLNTKKEVDDEI
ncbi:acetylornithine deacetylase [Lactobacillus sp. Sy-1]|uniref:acetylornithine deacetylase n=1 Tax=Lactobacillus sp. Sy-1 TaxID=2109645 RepID=UPI001C5BBEDB|nr:acetylornithine deacetylase [Lactobacillus sp. Sy-1]MBW1606250.1 acetylornithine deacetylase [Lactobacillus sp. Sy-1]